MESIISSIFFFISIKILYWLDKSLLNQTISQVPVSYVTRRTFYEH